MWKGEFLGSKDPRDVKECVQIKEVVLELSSAQSKVGNLQDDDLTTFWMSDAPANDEHFVTIACQQGIETVALYLGETEHNYFPTIIKIGDLEYLAETKIGWLVFRNSLPIKPNKVVVTLIGEIGKNYYIKVNQIAVLSNSIPTWVKCLEVRGIPLEMSKALNSEYQSNDDLRSKLCNGTIPLSIGHGQMTWEEYNQSLKNFHAVTEQENKTIQNLQETIAKEQKELEELQTRLNNHSIQLEKALQEKRELESSNVAEILPQLIAFTQSLVPMEKEITKQIQECISKDPHLFIAIEGEGEEVEPIEQEGEKGIPLSFVFNSVGLSPKSIASLAPIDGFTFLHNQPSILCNDFEIEEFEERKEILYLHHMLQGKHFPFKKHQENCAVCQCKDLEMLKHLFEEHKKMDETANIFFKHSPSSMNGRYFLFLEQRDIGDAISVRDFYKFKRNTMNYFLKVHQEAL